MQRCCAQPCMASSCSTSRQFSSSGSEATEFYSLSLHDALPISSRRCRSRPCLVSERSRWRAHLTKGLWLACFRKGLRSEEHTSELQSHSDLVCRLLLEKKNDAEQLLVAGAVHGASVPRVADIQH